MIVDAAGNLLLADAEALVNTVNCVGYMGKGIALQFRQAYPGNYAAYHRACERKEVVPGRMFVHATENLTNPQYIINFPTKRHWRANSRLEDIASGLQALIHEVRRLGLTSVAVPPLGCGNGGLDWGDVRPLIEEAFGPLPDVRVLLYPPAGAPNAKSMPVGTKPPEMTHARALVLLLMDRYTVLGYRLTLLEIQKLAYFAQEAGERLELKYVAGLYGPYATNLNKILERLEGHFTRGIGDSPKPDRDIELLPGAVDKAATYLESAADTRGRLTRVAELIDGFETPYGMELLATVHWVGRHAEPRAADPDAVVQEVHAWSDRKRRLFRPEHVRIAWERLAEIGWLPGHSPDPAPARPT